MADIKRVSPSVMVYKAYPDAFWNSTNAIVKVRYVNSQNGELRDRMSIAIREQVAHLITEKKRKSDDFHTEVLRRNRLRPNSETELASASLHNEAQAQNIDTLLFDDDDDIGVILNEEESLAEEQMQVAPPVRANRLAFFLVDEMITIKTEVYPRSFHCRNCGHFEGINPKNPPSQLRCTCCRTGKLIQEPIVFGCARCADIRELAPKGGRKNDNGMRKTQYLQKLLGKPLACPDCSIGHIHLEKHNDNSVSRWQWYCQNCDSYRESLQESCLRCYMPPGENPEQEPKSIITMNAFPASASNALYPLIDVQMFIRDQAINPDTFYEAAQKAAEDWSDYFELKREAMTLTTDAGNTVVQIPQTLLTASQVEQLTEACISNAYLLNHVKVVTTVYGYQAGGSIMTHPVTPVEQGDRFAQFFRDPEDIAEYVCYGMLNEGAALVLELDKKLIMEHLAYSNVGLDGLSYEDVLAEERERLQVTTTPLRELLQSQDIFPLFSALHALEHALLANSIRLIGNEILGSTMFYEAGKLLIYEREPVGRGGVVQLVNRGLGLVNLLTAAANHLAGCAQGCIDGCPICIFIPDTQCQYRAEEFDRSWLPPNILLSRKGASLILNSDLMDTNF